MPPTLYYWQREKKGSQAEVDYVIQHENQVIPLEVKAGTIGSLKSLQEFVREKHKLLAIRINSNKPSLYQTSYKLLSLPFYLLSQVHRLIRSASSID
jgi:predicted AAA+ superfamily ATPase